MAGGTLRSVWRAAGGARPRFSAAVRLSVVNRRAAKVAAARTSMVTASTATRRRLGRRRRGCADAPILATRSRSDDGAATDSLRSSRARPCRRASSWVSGMAPARSASRRAGATSSGDDMGFHPLFELLQGSREPHRARAAADSEHPRRGDGVELEHDAQDDDLALPGAQRAQSRFELRRDPFGERLGRRAEPRLSSGPRVFRRLASARKWSSAFERASWQSQCAPSPGGDRSASSSGRPSRRSPP